METQKASGSSTLVKIVHFFTEMFSQVKEDLGCYCYSEPPFVLTTNVWFSLQAGKFWNF